MQINVQQDAKRITWSGSGGGQFYAQSTNTIDRQDYLNADSALVFDTIVHQAPAGQVKVRVDCAYPCIGELDGTTLFGGLSLETKHSVKIPLSCFAAKGTDFTLINTPFLVFTDKAFTASFANIRWVPNAGLDADAEKCSDMVPPTPVYSTPVAGPSYTLFANGVAANGFQSNTWSTNNVHTSYAIQPGGEISLDFANDGENGLFFFNNGNPFNLVNYASGKMEFEIFVTDYGSNTSGLVVKIESAGTNCNTSDHNLGRPSAGSWQTISLNMSDITSAATSCFDLQNITVPFGTLPTWGDQQGVKFSVRNIKFVQ